MQILKVIGLLMEYPDELLWGVKTTRWRLWPAMSPC